MDQQTLLSNHYKVIERKSRGDLVNLVVVDTCTNFIDAAWDLFHNPGKNIRRIATVLVFYGYFNKDGYVTKIKSIQRGNDSSSSFVLKI